jgi:hypothetical protein
MSRTYLRWTIALGAALGLSLARANAQDGAWRPAAKPVPAPAVVMPAGPAATLGRPVAVDEPGAPPPLPPLDLSHVSRAEPIPDTWADAVIVQTQGPPAVPPPDGAPVPPGGIPPVPPYHLDPNVNTGDPLTPHGGFWNNSGVWGGKWCKFQSDHCFDYLISPVSNPFFFEDPRSLTEARPIFFIQSIPGRNGSGNAEFFGVQGRVALTERWSVVMNKFGLVSLNPNDTFDQYEKGTAFAEFYIGPKWTFLRSDSNGTVAAAGLTFEIPTSTRAAQSTGNFGLDPYITIAQNFGRLPQGFGSFNFMAEAGYSFATDNQRAEFFHMSFHLDYDVANLHRLYPLIELNWFHNTKLGNARDLNFEGTDLVNFGSRDLQNRDLVTLAFGGRYKIHEWMQVGTAFEFPLTSRKDLSDFRWTIDLIFRY